MICLFAYGCMLINYFIILTVEIITVRQWDNDDDTFEISDTFLLRNLMLSFSLTAVTAAVPSIMMTATGDQWQRWWW